MLPTFRILACSALLLFLAPIRGMAATIGESAFCYSTSQSSSQAGTVQCSGYYFITPGDEVFPDASASVSAGSSPFSVTVSASAGDHGQASASYSAMLLFTITGGAGSGEFSPCFGGPLTGIGATTSLEFASVFANPSATCPATLSSGDFVPFVFGVQQSDQLILIANAAAGPTGGAATGSLFGFVALDAEGNVLSNAVVNVVDPANVLPEPRLVAPLGIALLLGWALRRRTSGPSTTR